MMTLDFHYECETNWDIYVAAKDVELLLTDTYAMKTEFNTTFATETGDGYEVKGNNLKLQNASKSLNKVQNSFIKKKKSE
jgi:hypothetical protein